jgi:hypothetical protein
MPKTGYGEAQRWFRDHINYQGDECLIWPFAAPASKMTPNKKRPVFAHKGKSYGVSRAMCEENYGPPPTPKHESAHSCGNGHNGCVNPKHLRWATAQENTDDKRLHGTMLRGSQMKNSKINEDIAREMRRLYDAGLASTPQLSEMFGINPSSCWHVVARKTWRHVT